MNVVKDLLDAVLRVIFGQSMVDNTKEWRQSHDKANASRAEIKESTSRAEESK